VGELPDLQEAIHLLEQARRSLADDAIAEADRLLTAGDAAAARDVLVDGIALEPTDRTLHPPRRGARRSPPVLLLTTAAT
jgi:hypothetical protein